MFKFQKLYESFMEDIKLKNRADIIKTVNLKDKKGNEITINVHPSKNNYKEFSIVTKDKDGSIFEKHVYTANEVFTYLNDIISASEKKKLNVLHDLNLKEAKYKSQDIDEKLLTLEVGKQKVELIENNKTIEKGIITQNKESIGKTPNYTVGIYSFAQLDVKEIEGNKIYLKDK